MSRVVITDLVPPAVATTADVNATMTSWNNALAAGALGSNNVRPQGLDRRSLSAAARAISSSGQGSSPFYNSSTSSGAVTNAGPAYTPIICGSTVRVGPTSPASGNAVIVRGSTHFGSEDTAVVNRCLVDVIFEQSTDNVVWTTVSGARQRFRCRAVAGWPTHVAGTATLAVLLTSDGAARWYRMSFLATPGNVFFYNAVLYVEVLAR